MQRVGFGGSWCGGPEGVVLWLAREPPKAGLAASSIIFLVNLNLSCVFFKREKRHLNRHLTSRIVYGFSKQNNTFPMLRIG